MRAALIGLIVAGVIGSTTVNTPRIEEDSPLWNCHTMGNHICGQEIRA